MGCVQVVKALRTHFEGVVANVTPGSRIAGGALPSMSYDIIAMEAVITAGARAPTNTRAWTIGVGVVFVAESLLDVCSLVDDLLDSFDGYDVSAVSGSDVGIALRGFEPAFDELDEEDGKESSRWACNVALAILATEEAS